MAIRDDNAPPRSPGSITQTADSQIDRVGNVSNVSKTISNMQKDVKQRMTETQQAVDEGQSISMVQKSMSAVLDKLAGTVDALSKGVKTITVDTAQATKETISQYGKAISEDISFNKQSVVAMALAKSTPIYGYFVAKFMETDVFKKAAEKMKASIGKAFGSLAGVFRRGKKGGNEDTNIPKMHSGGYVKKGGLTELHAGEVVAPIEKILQRIDDSISTTKDLAKITEKTALHMTTDLKGYIKSSSASDKSQMNIFRSFIRTYKEVGERAFTEQPVERMARSLLAIQDTLGAQIGNMEQVWQEMLANHPGLVKLRLGLKAISGVLTAPYKIIRAFMRVRGFGGYRAKLSKAKNPLQATAENIATLYVDLMWRLDSMMPMIKLSAQANRDVAAKLTGNVYPRVKGVPKEKRWSINKVASQALGVLPGLATSIIGQSMGGLGGLLGKKEGKLGTLGRGMKGAGGFTDKIGQWLMEGGGEVGKKKRLEEMKPGAIPDSLEKGFGMLEYLEDYHKNFLPMYKEYITQRKEITEWQLSDMRNEIERKNLESGVLLLEYKKAEEELPKLIEERKNKKKEKKRRKFIDKAYQSTISMASRLRRFLTKDRIMKWLMMAGAFISSAITTIGSVIGGLFLPGGAILTAVMGIGPMIMTAIASAPFWVAILAGLAGAGIGTFIQRQFIAPWLAKKEKEQREKVKQHDSWEAKRTKEARAILKEKHEIPEAAKTGRDLAQAHMSRFQTRGKMIGRSAAAMKQMQGVGILNESRLDEIRMGMEQFRNQHIGEYLLYDTDGIIAMREAWDKRGGFRTRNAMRGENPHDYGMARERAFLTYLMGYGDNIKIAGSMEELGPVLMEKKRRKEQAEAMKRYQKNISDKDYNARREQEKKTGLGAEYSRKKNYVEQKVLQKLMLAKGVGKDWWKKLDAKSRAAFQEAKQFYVKEMGMSEAEADAQIADLAMKAGERYGMMTDPQTYKTLWEEGKSEAKERYSQAMDKKSIIINEASLHMANAEKIGVEIGGKVEEAAEKVMKSSMETGAQGSAVIVSGVTNAITTVSNSSAVQTGMDAGKRGVAYGREKFDEAVYALKSD